MRFFIFFFESTSMTFISCKRHRHFKIRIIIQNFFGIRRVKVRQANSSRGPRILEEFALSLFYKLTYTIVVNIPI